MNCVFLKEVIFQPANIERLHQALAAEFLDRTGAELPHQGQLLEVMAMFLEDGSHQFSLDQGVAVLQQEYRDAFVEEHLPGMVRNYLEKKGDRQRLTEHVDNLQATRLYTTNWINSDSSLQHYVPQTTLMPLPVASSSKGEREITWKGY